MPEFHDIIIRKIGAPRQGDPGFDTTKWSRNYHREHIRLSLKELDRYLRLVAKPLPQRVAMRALIAQAIELTKQKHDRY